MSQKNKLDFSEFFPIPPEQWKAAILKELSLQKEEELEWKYKNVFFRKVHSSRDKKFPALRSFHDHFSLKSPRHWYTCEYIEVNDPSIANQMALDALMNGADALEFNIKNATLTSPDLRHLLKDIELPFAPIHFRISGSLQKFCKLLSSSGCEALKGSLRHPVAEIHEDTILYHDQIDELAASISLLENIPQLRAIGIETSPLHRAGVSPEKEIAFCIAAAIDMIDFLNRKKISTNEALSRLTFSFSVGKSFLPEIAKLRAFRFLLNEVVKTMDTTLDSFSVPVHCCTASHEFSEDVYYNILHNTTESLAAVIGGCDSLTILPFDIHQKGVHSFSSRISRNISLLMKEEAYLGTITDPAAGSYTLEEMTFVLAEKSLELLRTIENKGGLSKAITKL